MKDVFLTKSFEPKVALYSALDCSVDCRALIIDNAFAGILCRSPKVAYFLNSLKFDEITFQGTNLFADDIAYADFVGAVMAASRESLELARKIIEEWEAEY